MRIQFTLDCADPHGLAAFYAACFGYEVEDHETGIRRLMEQGLVTEADVIEVNGHLAFRDRGRLLRPDRRTPAHPFPTGTGGQGGQEPAPPRLPVRRRRGA